MGRWRGAFLALVDIASSFWLDLTSEESEWAVNFDEVIMNGLNEREWG